MTQTAEGAIEGLANENGAGIESTVRRIRIKTALAEKMQRLYPLFADDPANIPKEAEVMAFMIDKAFEVFLTSGEIEKRLAEIARKA